MLMTRQKEVESMPLLIEDINNNITGNIFHVVVLVTYRTFLYKTNRSKEIFRADVTYKKVEMTITLLVPTSLIEQHESNIISNVGVPTKYFEIIPKRKYDSGDCEKTICLNSFISIEKLCPVCAWY